MKEIIDLLQKAKKDKATVFVCGNGGSAANAEHFSNDLFSKGIKAICLNSNNSIITMIANDFGYEYIFSRQLEVFAKPNDVLIVFSCSGNSKNILEALKFKCGKIGFLGKGGKAKKLVNFGIFINSGNYGIIESKHALFAHKVASSLF